MSETNTQHHKAIPSLDGIRAIAVLIVILAHSGFTAVPGGLGVTVFFFLSGYLITTLLLAEHKRTGHLDVPKFYARRMFRLMPPLLVTLAIVYALTFAGLVRGGITAGGLASQLFYFANYYGIFFDPGDTIPEGTGVLWSLAVEEHFYIAYPIVMGLLLRRAPRPVQIAALMGTACLIVLAWRTYLVHTPNFVFYRTYYASDTRIDSIIYGCILAVIANPWQPSRPAGTMSPRDWTLFFAGLACVLITIVVRNETFRETLRYSLQGLALMPIFYFAIRFSNNHVFRYLNTPLAIRLGTYSYAVYLLHHVMIYMITTNVPTIASRPIIVFPAALLVSIAYAAAVDRFVDPYFRRLRLRFRPKLETKAAVRQDASRSDA